ncbi:putative bacterial non-heme ferritin [invertebrate metagenome]|uniref:Putative bacterial non-heme ferritin n=1 Tax=invertebrate metagenome TaxID=1711999 RepID=A0A2H9TA68_9ZZZZ
MLSTQITEQLNQQINLECYSVNLYLQMSSWCHFHGMDGCRGFLQRQSHEEAIHLKKLFAYVNESGAMAILGAQEAPPDTFSSVGDIFRQTYQHEQVITQHINDLVDTALQEKDYSTFNLLQWFVAEQHEEENLFKGILDKFDMLGDHKQSLYLIDQYVGRLNRELLAAGHSGK